MEGGRSVFHPILRACRDIARGEEILWDYGVAKDGYVELVGKQQSATFTAERFASMLRGSVKPKVGTSQKTPASINPLQMLARLRERGVDISVNANRDAMASLFIKNPSHLIHFCDSRFWLYVLTDDLASLDDDFRPQSTILLERELYIVSEHLALERDSSKLDSFILGRKGIAKLAKKVISEYAERFYSSN